MFNVIKASENKAVGHEDADRTFNTLVKELNHNIVLDRELIEAALWSANLLDERKDFWHPKDIGFDTFVKNLSPKFNRKYNLIEGD